MLLGERLSWQFQYNHQEYIVIIITSTTLSTRTLGKDDDDGSKNVGKKMKLRSFKLNRVYLDLLNVWNAGDLSWSWVLKDFIQVQIEDAQFVVVCPRPP